MQGSGFGAWDLGLGFWTWLPRMGDDFKVFRMSMRLDIVDGKNPQVCSSLGASPDAQPHRFVRRPYHHSADCEKTLHPKPESTQPSKVKPWSPQTRCNHYR